MVGGLADWFAVTALFRHPLGLPIPRTAIIPKSKDRIGEGLGQFVERNFLAPEILAAKLKQFAPARRLAEWLERPEHAQLVAARASEALPPIIRALDDRELRDFVARSFHEQLAAAELAPLLGRLLALLTQSGAFDAVFDRGLDAAQDALARNADRLYAMVAERSRWWIPRRIDRRIAEQIIAGIEEILAELRRPESDGRRRFRAALETFSHALVEAPEWRQRVAEIKDRLLRAAGGPGLARRDVGRAAPHRARRSRRAAIAHARGAQGGARCRSAARSRADAAMQERLDAGIEHLALAVVPWRGADRGAHRRGGAELGRAHGRRAARTRDRQRSAIYPHDRHAGRRLRRLPPVPHRALRLLAVASLGPYAASRTPLAQSRSARRRRRYAGAALYRHAERGRGARPAVRRRQRR